MSPPPTRDQRFTDIQRIVSNDRPASQDELVSKLRELGHEVTQSSVSRDLRRIGALKSNGVYMLAPELRSETSTDAAAMLSLVKKLIPAGENLLVVHTPAGAAQLVGSAIDALAGEHSLGSVAGDDTVFVATQNRAKQRAILSLIKSAMKESQA